MLQLQIECRRDEVDSLNELLEESGALSITLTDKQDDPILEPELGTTPLWPNVIIQALYAQAHEANLALEQLISSNTHLSPTIQPVPEQDWERAWMSDFKPLRFGKRLWICPSWSTSPDPNAANLILDPGLAFGTGTHPTTALCLTWLEQTILNHRSVIDYGCGSGILALAALKLGAQHVNAVDIDEQALLATRNNAQKNLIAEERLTIGFPESLTAQADLLIANILLSPLLALKTRFHELLKKQGILAVSGILEEQTSEVITGYQDQFTLQNTFIQDGWTLLVFKAN
ncbi:50S ribosomal protein L11 methyltransferase [Legionella nagasakiensis]|uniref:50S ribosomal protein L11 methyltransferase n=1 Tax=Legionella nagasakiensis TaxID=535290 RepID=UPI0010544767|nr:50S ribosomal protein L11 methyltransferase [Legionella nagasakiensis]